MKFMYEIENNDRIDESDFLFVSIFILSFDDLLSDVAYTMFLNGLNQ